MRKAVLLLLIVISLHPSATLVGQSSFQGVGDLPGGVYQSYAWDVSGDGTVVVGYSFDANNRPRGFRWVDTIGMVQLDPVYADTGLHNSNEAWAISSDGSTIVGRAQVGGVGSRPMYWRSGSGIRGIDFYSSVDESKDQSGGAWGVSADGSNMAGIMSLSDPDWNQANAFTAAIPGTTPMSLEGLGDTVPSSFAYGISGDGNTVVGAYTSQSWTDGSYPDTFQAVRWVNGSKMDLGNIGGGHQNLAYAISNNGTFITGLSGDGSTARIFRWSQAGGMDSIGLSPGVGEGPTIRGISDNGQVVVGLAGSPPSAFIWLEGWGILNLKAFLEDTLGLDLTGWNLSIAMGMSDDGSTVVGYGQNPSNQTEGWVANLYYLKVREPKEGQLVVAGEPDTIRWTALGVDSIDIWYSTNYDTSADTGTFELLDFDIPADSGFYVWEPPDTILSKTCAIRLVSISDTAMADTSGLFRIKGYVLTRDSADQWEPFRPEDDRWSFGNVDTNMWPPTWWTQFNYQTGINPDLGLVYPQEPEKPFHWTLPSDSPDWPLFASEYGFFQVYTISLNGLYKPSAMARWKSTKRPWKGSCSGFAISSIWAFVDSAGFFDKYSSEISPTNRLITVALDNDVRKIVNGLWIDWFGKQHQAWNAAVRNLKPTLALRNMKDILIGEKPIPGYLYISNQNGDGAHAITPYRITHRDGTSLWDIDVYDNSYPDTPGTKITVDTAANAQAGSWTSSTWKDTAGKNWGGGKGMYMMDPVLLYENSPILTAPTGAVPAAAAVVEGPEIYSDPSSDVLISAAGSGRIGHVDGATVDSLPGAYPNTPPTGAYTPPWSYALPPGAYRVTQNAFNDTVTSLQVYDGNRIFTYDRAGAASGQTDLFNYDGGFRTINPDTVTKVVTVGHIVVEDTSHEMAFGIARFSVPPGDSAQWTPEGGDRLKITGTEAGSTYDMYLTRFTGDAAPRYEHTNLSLAPGATHIIAPDWNDLTNPVLIYIDEGSDGSIDDSLYAANTVGIEERGSPRLPSRYTLTQNYPNPFNPTTRIDIGVPALGNVLVTVYDVLGREVEVLLDRVLTPGEYTVTWDASPYPAGVYFARMTAGSFTANVRLMYIK